MIQNFYMRPQSGERAFLHTGLIAFIDKFLNNKMVGCEIGVYGGEASVLFASKVEGLACIDTWSEEHNPTGQNQSMHEIEMLFDERVKGSPNIKKLKIPSLLASKTFNNESLDFVYIDAGHTYPNATEDLTAWYPKIKCGGVFAGHDYNNPEVSRAVNEFLTFIGKLPVMVFPDYSWLIVK
jgi:hypothetical protein